LFKNKAMKKFLIFSFLLLTFHLKAQSIKGTEFGFDGFFGASSLGSSYGIGPKFGMLLGDNFVIGPSYRLQQTTSNYLGVNTTRRIYGGGFFVHGRYLSNGKTHLYGGAEFEYLRSPFDYITFQELTNRRWAPTLFLTGGIKLNLAQRVSLTAGVYYDLINAKNSPFRSAYAIKIKNEQGQIVQILPIIYRLSIIFTLTKSEQTTDEDVDEQ
jgi:hypothetical protein